MSNTIEGRVDTIRIKVAVLPLVREHVLVHSHSLLSQYVCHLVCAIPVPVCHHIGEFVKVVLIKV